MQTLIAPPAKNLARTLITEALAVFCDELTRLGSPLPFNNEADLVIDYGSAINPHVVISFYTYSGNLLPLAAACVEHDPSAVQLAKKAMKSFVLRGGGETTQGFETQRTGQGYDVIVDFEREKTRVCFDTLALFPAIVFTNWQTGLLDLALVTKRAVHTSTRWFEDVEDQLAHLGYRLVYDEAFYHVGNVYLPADQSMAPLLVRYYGHAENDAQPEMSIEIFHKTGRPEIIYVSADAVAAVAHPVVCLLAQPVLRGIFSAIPV